ncbi:MAG: hypothetical protein WDO19_01535 [Bacteroidota bacterium]
MKYIINKLNGTSGIEIKQLKVALGFINKLPIYLNRTFKFYAVEIAEKKIILAELLSLKNFTPDQLKKQHYQLEDFSQLPVVFLIEHIEAYQRKRLVEKKIPFIVPGKQLYIPNLLIDLNESRRGSLTKYREKLSPAAQCLLLFHLQVENLDEMQLKIIAKKLNYSAMTVSRVAKELMQFSLCNITGTKQKAIDFPKNKKEIWNKALAVAINPVKQKVFVNQLPYSIQLPYSGETAMEHYTHLNAGKTKNFAIAKGKFIQLKRRKKFETNPYEGNYLLEVWNYNPELLSKGKYIDELSLYLSMKNNNDERTQIELEHLVNKMKW